MGGSRSPLATVDVPLVEERDHPVRPWALAIALAVVVAGVAWAFYHSPLVGGPLACGAPAELVPATETEDGIAAPARCVLAAGAAPVDVVVRLDLTNGGPLPVTVRGVDLGIVEELVELRGIALAVGPGEAGADGAAAAFSPVALGSGETGRLALALRVLPCAAARRGTASRPAAGRG
jgi:hypothetical protein